MEVGAFYLPSVGTKDEILQGMAGKRTDLYQGMLKEIGEQVGYMDQHGYYGAGFTEHHFHIEGEEVSTNPVILDLYFGMQTKNMKFGQLGNVPGHLFAWFFLFQLLALLMFGSLFIAVGAACSEIRDAQNLMFPVMMVVVIPMLTWMAVLQSPASPFSRALSLFPPATPMIMFLRIAIPPGVPAWEIALGLVLTTLFMLGCVWASAKIFRLGILSQGQTPSIPKLVAWVFSK